MVRVLLIDKQELFRYSFKKLIESEQENQVVLCTASFGDAKMKLFPGMVDVIIADIQDADTKDWNDLEEIIHHHPSLKLMVISNVICKQKFTKLLEFKVRAYYSKMSQPDTILDAIRVINSSYFDHDLKLGPIVRQQLTSNHVNRIASSVNFEKVEFSERELQIIDFIKKEWSSKQIAEQLNLSVRTIETHRRRMIDRTNSKSMLGVIVYLNEMRNSF